MAILSAAFRLLAGLLDLLLRRPLLCITLLWAAGILLATHWTLPWQYWAMAAFPLLITALLTGHGRETLARVSIAVAVVAAAAALCAWQTPHYTPDDPRYLPAGGVNVIGYPLSEAAHSAEGWRVRFRLTQRNLAAHWLPAAGEVDLAGQQAPPIPGHFYQLIAKVTAPYDAGNPFGFSWAGYLADHQLIAALRATVIMPLPGTAPIAPLPRLRAQLDQHLIATMPTIYRQVYAHLLDSLVLGFHGAPLPPVIIDQFRRAGTIHLIVASGSQVALLGGLLLIPLGLLSDGRGRTTYPRLRVLLLLLTLPLLALYVLLADRGPSIDRAALMLLLGILSLFLAFSPLARRRTFRPDALTLWAAAALILFICQSSLLFSPGMQLSFGAVFGIITITPVLVRCLQPWLGPLCLWPALTLGAQLLMLPVLAWQFGTIPALAPVTNFIAIPLAALLLPMGFAAMLCAAVVPALAVGLNCLNVPLMSVLLATNTIAAQCPLAEWHQVMRSPWATLGYLAALALVIRGLARWADTRPPEWRVPTGREPIMW